MDIESYAKERKLDAGLKDELMGFHAQDPSSVRSLLTELSPSANTLRDILRFLREISARDKLELTSLLSDENLVNVLNAEKLSRADKTKQVKRFLEQKRYPEKAAIQESLEVSVKELLRDTGLRFKLPPELEGDKLSVELSVKSLEEVERAAAAFSSAAEHPALNKIFSTLKGDY